MRHPISTTPSAASADTVSAATQPVVGAGVAMGASDDPPAVPMDEGTASGAHDPSLEPTDAEIDAWAARERERREAWLSGPTPEERAAFARREYRRRTAEHQGLEQRTAELARLGARYTREGQLATEGAVSLILRWARQARAELIRAGLEWEDEMARSRPRRVPPDED
jgi:hypothetical protein